MSDTPDRNPYAPPEDVAASDAASPDEVVSTGEKIGYGLGDTASNLYWKLFEFFQLKFYVDVFDISAAAAGTMFFVTKLWDAINDPLVGFISDRTRTAWGRFRPYLIWMAIPFALTGIFTFYTPDLSPRGKLIYAYVTYTLVFMAYTAINIPYGALMGVISPSPAQRTSVSTYRFILAFLGGLIVQKFTEPLLGFFGGTREVTRDGKLVTEVVDPQAGFFWTVVCYAVVAVILFVITFLTTKERVKPQEKQRSTLGTDVSDLMRNRPWMVLLGVGLFQIMAGWTRGSAIAFYFENYVNAPFGNFLVAATIAGIVGMLFTGRFTKIFGRKMLMIYMNVANAILTAMFYFLGPDQIAMMYALNIAAAFVTGPVPVLLWSMYADVADYSEWKTERRATGLVFSAATFSQKLGGAMGAAIPGWLLSYYQYKPPVDGVKVQQTETTINGMILMMSLIPAAFLLMAAVCLLFYNISESMLTQIETDLRNRKLNQDSE